MIYPLPQSELRNDISGLICHRCDNLAAATSNYHFLAGGGMFCAKSGRRAWATPPYPRTMYVETHRSGKLSVNHRGK